MGYCLQEGTPLLTSGEAEVELRLAGLFSAILRVSKRGGGDLACSDALLRSMSMGWSPPPTLEKADPLSAVLAGFPLPKLLDSEAPAIRLLLFTKEDDSHRLGPFSFSCFVLGFEPVSGEFWMDRLDHGIPVHTIELSRSAHEGGSLRVSLSGYFYAEPEEPSPHPLGVIQLVADGRTTEIQVASPSVRELFVSPIPAASYRVSFFGHSWLYRFPSLRAPDLVLSIPPGAEAERMIDLSGLGALEIQALAPGGHHSGAASFWLTPSDAEGSSNELRFDRPPYRIHCIAPGEYVLHGTIRLDGFGENAAYSWTAIEPHRIAIVANGLSRATIQVP